MLLLFAASASSWAQATKLDGAWLKRGLDAAERINAMQTSSEDDFAASMAAVSYINGVVSAHRDNSFKAKLIAAVALTNRDSEGRKAFNPAEEATIKTAMLFAPLRDLPDDVSRGQVFAIVNKYLSANPEKWNQSADSLIVDALSGAFKRQ